MTTEEKRLNQKRWEAANLFRRNLRRRQRRGGYYKLSGSYDGSLSKSLRALRETGVPRKHKLTKKLLGL